MPLTQLLTVDRIAAAVSADDGNEVLECAARLLSNGSPTPAAAIAASLRQRERLGSTAIGHGIAIPHGRSDAFAQPRGAFLRLERPVEFGAGDEQAVDLVFALIVPEHFTQQHLELLSELAERFADAGFRTALREAGDAQSLLRLFAESARRPDRHLRSGTARS
jgi:PTS system nitrogen regulatory IIA component